MFYERWTSKDALDRHLQTPHLKEFFAVEKDLLDGGMNIRLFQLVG